MHKKILVIAPPRTGSTALVIAMAATYRLDNHYEFFNPIRLSQNMDISEWYTDELATTEHRMESVLNFLKNQQNWVIKIQPAHFYHFVHQKWVPKNCNDNDELYRIMLRYYDDLVDISNFYRYLYRRNFKNQVRSWSIGKVTDNFSWDRNPQQPVIVPDSVIIRSQADVLQNYQMIKAMYTHRPGKIMALEDISSRLMWNVNGVRTRSTYPAYQNVQGNFDLIQDFDVEQEVFGIKRGGHCTPHPSI